jgi:hypothetical protein
MDDLLQQGVNAFKSGDHETARKLFISAVKQYPDNERAWGWMYTVCRNDQERIHCLKQVVRINPQNERAKQLLNKLSGADLPLEGPAIAPTNVEPQTRMEQVSPSLPISQAKDNVVTQKTSEVTKQRNLLIGIGAVLFICLICLCIPFLPDLSLTNLPASSPEPTTITIDSHGIEVGMTSDEVLAIRREPISIVQVGQDSQGLIVEWTYPDLVYTMRLWELDGINAYRVWEIKSR